MSRLINRLHRRSLFIGAAILALPALAVVPASAKSAPIRIQSPVATVAQSQDPAVSQARSTANARRAPARDFFYPDEPIAFIQASPAKIDVAAMNVPSSVFENTQKIGDPYTIAGKVYHPEADPYYDEVGTASWYGPKFHGRDTANGEVFDMTSITAAHPTLPIPSLVQVINLENGREIVVRINDRGPFAKDRIIDLSQAAARALDMESKGKSEVRVRYLGPAPKIPEVSLAQSNRDEIDQRSTRSGYAVPPVGGQYYVQAGSFQNMDNARAMHSKLSPQFEEADIVSAHVRGKNHFRVMIGPFSDRNAAEVTNVTLASKASVEGLVIHNP